VETGSAVSPWYDPMIAKVIAHGANRDAALDRLANALGATVVIGPHANAAFLKALADHPDFRAGRHDTGFIDRHLAQLTAVDPAVDAAAIAAAVEALLAPPAPAPETWHDHWNDPWNDPWAANDGFSLGPARQFDLDIVVDGHPAKATVTWRDGAHVTVDGIAANARRLIRAGAGMVAIGHGVQRQVALKGYDTVDVDHLDGDGVVKAPMHGKVLAIFVEAGANVAKGERVAVVEAMKMEHALLAPADGIVREIAASVGAQIAEGATILVVESATADE
jgi:3-methylcrotonyl-CoA carboxylase alpha subunit